MTKMERYRWIKQTSNYMPILSQWIVEVELEEVYCGFNPLTYCNAELSYLEPVN